MLEAAKHCGSAFVTLTYSDENLPVGATLVPQHLTDFMKRLRFHVEPIKVRYYAVGEYGEVTHRPHYHLALFGLDPMSAELAVKETWKLGLIHVGDVTPHSAQYIAGYVTKKLTKKDDPRLDGRHPEFARMSLRPDIGAGAMVDVAEALHSRGGAMLIAKDGDVPGELGSAKKKLPLGRYLRGKLREEMGMEAKPVGETEYGKEMQALQNEVGKTIFKTAKPFVEWDKLVRNEARERSFRKARKL